MTRSLAEIAERALSHDPIAALADLDAQIAADGESAVACAVRAFVQVLNCQFDAAIASAPAGQDPLSCAMAGFVSAVCLALVPTVSAPDDLDDEYRGLFAFVAVEASMSAGQIARAEEQARRSVSGLVVADGGTFWAWNQVALARSLAFQGRFTEARSEIEAVLTDDRRDSWPAVDRIARGVQAFVAAHEGDPSYGERFAGGLVAEVPEPRTYMESSAFVLAAFAEQAAGRAGGVEELLLHGGGGDYLQRFQIVDRVYCYEILVESALAAADVVGAHTWLDLAEALPTEDHDMAGAALARIRARIAMALDDPETGERESIRSEQRAALVGGSLEVLRSQLLQAVAARAQGAPVDIEGLEQVAELAASTGARVVREWAVRELGLQGRRLRNVPGQGWSALTDRQRLVAVLAAQGLRNREIGGRLFVSERTVEGHIAAVLDALGAPSRVGIGAHLPLPAGASAAAVGLTPRQRDVASLIAAGRSNAEIADTLGISEKTVEKHVADLFGRLKVQSRAGIAALVRSG